jgi:hypothetical protein
MNLVDILVLVLGLAVVGAFVCRLDALHIKTDSLGQIGLNVTLAGAVMSASTHAWTGAVDLQDVCIVVAGLCWIVTTLPAWRRRSEAFADTLPAEVQPSDLGRIAGGRRETPT